eukprot:gnl/MRDRNA2_/MRDRNA2_72776_c0_seq1.p1 gnl/MRDRNA2_/MRDRNA2_72776_c0~~gnl/MRDRNA2_/MRDRNA2_72776_c0_seq1.p1  ORF type:complete len:898 (+),score=169.74 gnl/MRDRNA2_/MRDRNA2_72776_c0_seq1:368-2695(+)
MQLLGDSPLGAAAKVEEATNRKQDMSAKSNNSSSASPIDSPTNKIIGKDNVQSTTVPVLSISPAPGIQNCEVASTNNGDKGPVAEDLSQAVQELRDLREFIKTRRTGSKSSPGSPRDAVSQTQHVVEAVRQTIAFEMREQFQAIRQDVHELFKTTNQHLGDQGIQAHILPPFSSPRSPTVKDSSSTSKGNKISIKKASDHAETRSMKSNFCDLPPDDFEIQEHENKRTSNDVGGHASAASTSVPEVVHEELLKSVEGGDVDHAGEQARQEKSIAPPESESNAQSSDVFGAVVGADATVQPPLTTPITGESISCSSDAVTTQDASGLAITQSPNEGGDFTEAAAAPEWAQSAPQAAAQDVRAQTHAAAENIPEQRQVVEQSNATDNINHNEVEIAPPERAPASGTGQARLDEIVHVHPEPTTRDAPEQTPRDVASAATASPLQGAEQTPSDVASTLTGQPLQGADSNSTKDASDEVSPLRQGMRVRIKGLQTRQDLNGQEGQISEYDHSHGRWQVRLDAGSGMLLKAANLEDLTDQGLQDPNSLLVSPDPKLQDLNPHLKPGIRVRCHGLEAFSNLNGVEGVLVEFDVAKERWKVRMDNGTGKIMKAVNLEVCSPDGALRSTAVANRAAPPLAPGVGRQATAPLAAGARVCVAGLRTRLELNGQAGYAVECCDASQDLWRVRMDDGSGKVFKSCNLHVVHNAGSDTSETLESAALRGLAPGVRVRLVGLQAWQDLNGLEGVLHEYLSSQDRWKVRMDDASGKIIRSANLEILSESQ